MEDSSGRPAPARNAGNAACEKCAATKMATWRNTIRHARLISLDYSPVSRSYPHPNPQPGSGWRAERAMASGFLAWMCELSAAGGRDSGNRKRVLGPGPPDADFSLRFFLEC